MYVFPQFERTVEILKETGYPISMEEVNVTSVEVQYYMNEEKTEYSSPVIYDDPGELEELKKVLKCYSFIPVWENPESDNWESLKVRIKDRNLMICGRFQKRIFRNLCRRMPRGLWLLR